MGSFSGFGVRTISASECRYNPMAYHNGSIWPHDNAMIAAGLARYGFRREAGQIFEGLFAASTYMDLRRLPELFCGFPRQIGTGPVFYPVACSPQAWATGAPLMLIQACLGIDFDARSRRIHFDHPTLPDFVDNITLRGLRIEDGSVDVAFRRAGANVVMEVLARVNDCDVVMTI